MKKVALALAFLAITITTVMGQKKYEKMVYKPVTFDGEDITVIAKDIVSNKELTKFQLRISNKSDHILIYKPEESSLKLPSGKELKPTEKWLVIQPTDEDYRTVNFSGPDFMIPEYSFNVDGMYTVSNTETAVEAPEFSLPPSTNDFKAGKFSCNMTDLKKETDKTTVKFECRYTGDKIGVINPGRAAIKLPDGTEIANAKSTSKSEVLMKGDTKRITLSWNRMEGGKTTDMQLIKMQILWRNTFVESEGVKLKPVIVEMKLDESLSK